MKPFLKHENIYYFTTLYYVTKVNVSERATKNVKNMMYPHFTKLRPHISYNVTPHRSLNNIAPKDVNKNKEADI